MIQILSALTLLHVIAADLAASPSTTINSSKEVSHPTEFESVLEMRLLTQYLMTNDIIVLDTSEAFMFLLVNLKAFRQGFPYEAQKMDVSTWLCCFPGVSNNYFPSRSSCPFWKYVMCILIPWGLTSGSS